MRQLFRRMFSALTQYCSLLACVLSILLATELNRSAALRSASSLDPMTICALNACKDGIGGSFDTTVPESAGVGVSVRGFGWVVDKKELRMSLACVISPRAMLIGCA
jgi:hypothetical protein